MKVQGMVRLQRELRSSNVKVTVYCAFCVGGAGGQEKGEGGLHGVGGFLPQVSLKTSQQDQACWVKAAQESSSSAGILDLRAKGCVPSLFICRRAGP